MMSPTPKALAVVAAASWLASLALTGISAYPGQQQSGLIVLAIGWLAVITGNLAWLANGFFAYSFWRLIAGRRAVGSAFFAALFSLDTFRLGVTLSHTGELGRTVPIYGYGWGAILWMLAMFVLLAAAVLREPNVSKTGKALGILPSVILAAGFAFWAVNDRIEANAAEAKRLASGLAFKRGDVCGASDPSVAQPIRGFSGVLDVQANGRTYPFGQVKDLLQWGIPVIRVGGVDYSLAADGGVAASQATGEPSAVLWVSNAIGG